MGIISDKKGSEYYNGKLDALWVEHSDNLVEIHGGRSVVFDPSNDGWEAWVPTIKDSPSIVDYTLQPISSLVMVLSP